MIIAKLQGGLGNQMFQYAAARGIGRLGYVYLDTSFLRSHKENTDFSTPRALELQIFDNLKYKISKKYINSLVTGKHLVYRKLKDIFFSQLVVIRQSEQNECVNLTNLNARTVYLDGYFQHENYFKAIRQELLIEFQFPVAHLKNKRVAEMIGADENAIAMHVRRGDYLKPAVKTYHGVLPLEYYAEAKKIIEKKVTNPHYYIFSDDPDWCVSVFGYLNAPFTIGSSGCSKAWEDMYLMSLCKHQIIANSSYSWWSAWLNPYPDKVVIAPERWFQAVNTDIVPCGWIKI